MPQVQYFNFAKKTNKKEDQKQKEKAEIKEQFADVDTDDIKDKFVEELMEVEDELVESLK